MNANVLAPSKASSPVRRDITREIAAYATGSQWGDLPAVIRAEGARAFVNWMGCVWGGCRDAALDAADAALGEFGGPPQASVIGRGHRTDVVSAAFLNCLSSTVNSFDDTHLATVTHPTGPVAAALFAHAQQHTVSGEEFVHALVLGIEIECRLSNLLLLPPAQANLGLFITGITGPIGAAVALGRLMRLDEQHMCWAIGLAAAQAAGFRATHGAMSAFMVPAQAARTGVWAARMASKGFTCTEQMLQAPKGFVDTFAPGADLDQAVGGLGSHFELLANAYKPYPSGIVIQPAIDACLDLVARLPPHAMFKRVLLRVHPLALDLCGRREPRDPVEAQISLFHWAAACLRQGAAGLPQLDQACIDDPGVAAVRALIEAHGDPTLQRDEAWAEVDLADGTVLRAHVKHARGSAHRPMTDDELDAKFRAQVAPRLPAEACERLLALSRQLAELSDVGVEIGAVWAPA